MNTKLRPILPLILASAILLLIAGCGGADSGSSDESASIDTPIVFSPEQAPSLLLEVNDFPDGWKVTREGLGITAKHIEFLTVKSIELTLVTHETEAAAQAAFSIRKTEAQTAIEDRGISGDELETIKNYQMFVWLFLRGLSVVPKSGR